MPDFSNPIVPVAPPMQSSVKLQDIAMPRVNPTVTFNSSDGNGIAFTAAEVRDALLGQGREIDYFNKGKAPAYGISVPYNDAKRYNDPNLGYSPFRDNEELYAQNQSVLQGIGAGLGRLGLTTLTKLGTGLGYLGGLITSAFDPQGRSRYGEGPEAWLANAADNALSYQFDKWEQGVKNDLLPLYQEAADRNKGFFSRAATDLNFWTDDVVDGAAFMASALVPGLAVSKLGTGARTLAGLARLFGYSDEALDAARAAQLFGGSIVDGAMNASTELNYIPKVLRIASNAKVARGVDVGIQTLISTGSEAMFEANETKNRIYDNLISQGVDTQTAANKAAVGARDTYLMNLGALMFSNLWEANLIFKKLPSASNEALGAATRTGLFGATQIEKRGLAYGLGKSALTGLGVEGLYEENVQLAIQRINEGNPGDTFGNKLKNIASQTAEQTVNAILGKDPEAAMNIGIGGLIGIGAGGIGRVRENFSNEKYRQKVEGALNSYGAAFQSLKNVYNADGTINEKELMKVAASQGNVLELMDLIDVAEKNQLPVLKDIYEGELFAQFAHAHFQNGQADLLIEKLDNISNLTDDDLQSLGFDPQNKEGASEKVQQLKKQAVDLQQLYDNIQQNVVGNDSELVEFRKAELFRLGARSMTLNRQSQRIQSELDILNGESNENPAVNQLNQLISKKKAAQNFVDALENEDVLNPGTVDAETLKQRKKTVEDSEKEIEDFKKANDQSLLSAKEDTDGYYSTDKATEDVLRKANRRLAELKLAEIQLSKNSVDERFNRIGNPATGNKFTKEYHDRILKTRNPEPTRTSFPLGNVRTSDYQSYESGRLRRQRIQSAVNDIEREMRSELISSNVDAADLPSLLSLIDESLDKAVTFNQVDKDKIKNSLSNAIDGTINDLQKKLNNYTDRLQKLQVIDPEDMTDDQADEYDFLVNEIPNIESQIQEFNNMKNRADNLGVYTPEEKTENLFRREIAEEYFVEPNKIIKDIQQSSEGYDTAADLDNIDNQIRQLENLRDIFNDRKDLIDASEFVGFIDRINDLLNQLRDARAEISRRVTDRALADEKALNNHINITGKSVGINVEDGSLTSLHPIVSDIISAAFPSEFAALNTEIQEARDGKDNKRLLYALEAVQSLLKRAITSNTEARKKFESQVATLKNSVIADFLNQPGLATVKKGNISESQIQEVYSKNPANVFRYIINTISNQDYDLDRKDSPIYKYRQSLNITEFLSNAKEDNREGQSLSKDDLVSLIQVHLAYQAINELEKVMNSSITTTEEVENELNTINKSITEASKQQPDNNIIVQTPSNEQLIALRQLVNFLFTKPEGSAFSNWVYLKGAAGTGKSQIISKWLLKLAKISTKNVYAIGHTQSSSANINSVLGKGEMSPLASDLINALNNNEPMQLILVDEIGGFDANTIISIEEALDKYNKANKTDVKVITLGDPNQLNVDSSGSLSLRPAIETVQYTKTPPFSGRLNNLTVISPLTIRYRSDVGQITNFSDKFINQNRDLSNEEMIVTSNNPTLTEANLQNEDLLGVVGTQNFAGTLQRILPILTKRNDGRSRAIITTPSKVAQYTSMLQQAGIDLTQVEVLSYIDAQGRTIDEVYIDIPNSSTEFSNDTIYNKAMYVATSRATSFVLISNYKTTNEVDKTIGTQQTNMQNAVRDAAETFKNDRIQESDLLKKYAPVSQENKVTVDSKPEETKPTPAKQVDIEELAENEEENPVPPATDNETEPTTTKDEVSDEIYNEYVKNGKVPPEELERIANKIVAGKKLSYRELSIMQSYASAVNDILIAKKSAEITVDFDKNTIHNLKFPTSEAAANIVTFEGAITPTYVSPRALAALNKANTPYELKSSATKVGDKVFYTAASHQGQIFFVLLTEYRDGQGNIVPNRYRQLGVLSDEELENMGKNEDLKGLQKILIDYKDNPNSKAIQIDLDKNEFNIPNLTSVIEGNVANIDYVNFQYNKAPVKFDLNSIVNQFARSFFPNESDLSKRIDQVKRDAKIIIYRAGDKVPNENMKPGIPYLILSNLGQGTSRKSKPMYIELDARTLNEKDHAEFVAPIKEFVNVIEKLESLIADGDFRYGNAVFENAIIKIARRNKTGLFEVAGREINVTKEILDLTRRADILHLKPSSESLKIGSKVKYVNPEESFTAVGIHKKDDKGGTYKKGDKYTYRSSGKVVELQTGVDPNTDKETIVAAKVSYDVINEAGETEQVTTDFIPVSELTNSQTENGKAQVALNALWKANEANVKSSEANYVTGEQIITNSNGEKVTKKLFQYPSILRSESTNSGFNPEALNILRAITDFDENGNHKGSPIIGSLRVPVPRNTTGVNFTNSGQNSIDDRKTTSKYLQTSFSGVTPTRVSVSFSKSTDKTSPTRTETEIKSQPAPKPTTKKINIPRGRALSSTLYNATQLGKSISHNEARKLIKSKLPGLTEQQIEENIKFVDAAQMMKITGGKEAWGYFVDNLIYLQNSSDNTVRENTVRHEVAHYVFNNYLNQNERDRFISDLKKEKPFLNFMTNDELLEYVDEYIAEGYQNFKSRPSISTFIKNILRKIASFLGFATPFIRNLNDYFEAIENGFFTKPSNQQLLVGRPLLSIKEHFDGNVQNYIRSQQMFGYLINYFINPTESIIEGEDGILENIPLSREESVARAFDYFQDRASEFNSISDKTTITPEELQDYEVSLALVKRDKRGRPYIFEELVKDFYPNFRFVKVPGTDVYQAVETNKAFDYDYNSEEDYNDNLEDVTDTTEGEEDVAGNEGWLDNQDTINPLKKASQAVKDFMSSLVVKNGDQYERIRPGYVFYKLLQNLSGIDVNDLPVGNEVREEIRQIKENFMYNGMQDVEDESNRDWVIFNEISNLLNKTTSSVDLEGNRLPQNSYFQWIGDNQKGHYEFFHNGKIISGLVKGNKKPNVEFFKDIHTTTKLSYNTIAALYRRKEAAEAINSIYQVINSMRAKTPMFGEYEWKWTKGKQILKRVYGAFKDESSLSAAKAYVSNILATRYPRLEKFSEKLRNRKTEVNKVALVKSIMVDLGLIKSPNAAYLRQNDATNLLNVFDAILTLSKNIGEVTGTTEDGQTIIYDAQEFTGDLKQYITRIAKVVNSRKTEVGRSSSYIGGDGKPRWFFMNSTQAFDTFRKIIEQRPLRGFLANTNSIFSRNIFNPLNENKISNIYSLRDHDSVGEVDSQRDPVLYRRELTKDFIDRNFMYGFVNFLADSTNQGATYLQQFYTISNKPNILAAQVDLLNSQNLKDAIREAIIQESLRVSRGIANYDDNVKNRLTFLVGLENALTPEEVANKKTLKDAVDKVFNSLRERSAEAFEKYVALNPTLDRNFKSVYNNLINNNYIDSKALSTTEQVEDISKIQGTSRWDTANNPDFRAVVYPIFDLFYKNYFVNSIFINQLSSGDQAQYKDEYDEIKRMSMAFAIGYRGRVNDQTALRRTFNVAVAKDFKDVIGENTFIGRTFKKLLGSSYELTDAQGFMTPERAANIRRGFSREGNLGSTMKPVYFGIDNEGLARGIKYSSIELTNELVNTFPELAEVRYQMTFGNSDFNNEETRDLYNRYIKNELSRDEAAEYEKRVNQTIDSNNHIDELVFESAFKVGRPAVTSDWKNDKVLKPESIVSLTNDNYRHQLNPRHDADTKTSNPSQLTYQINTNGKNFDRLKKILTLNSLMHTYGLKSIMSQLFPNGDIDNRARREVRRIIASPLTKVPGNERYAEFIQDPEISLNLPNITNKLQQSFLAYISKRTIEIKHKGSKLVLQSSFGTQSKDILNTTQQTEPRLVFVDKNGVTSYEEGFDENSVQTYYMEVYLPNIYKNQNLSIGSDIWINDPVYSVLMGFRIPSTELHSAVPLKVKGFYPSTYGDNIIIAPKELVVLHGSDFDIDSLYTINKFVAHKDIVSPEGQQIAYEGVAVGYKYVTGRGTVPLSFLKNNQTFPEWLTQEMDRTLNNINNQENKEPFTKYLEELTNLLPQAASNEILNTFLETITAEENIQSMMSPISMAVFNDIEDENSVFHTFANLLAEKETKKPLPNKPDRSNYFSDSEFNKALKAWKNEAMSYIRPKRNLNLMDDEVEMHQDNFRASMGTGIAANAFKIISYIFMGATNMNIKSGLTEEEQELPKLKEDYWITINNSVYDGFRRYVNDGSKTTTFQIIDSIINAAIDHVKEQILNVVNISNKTINAYISMIAMGVDPKTTSLFVAQPALKELSNRSADRFALNNVVSELRQALMRTSTAQEVINRYREVELDEQLSPQQRNKSLNTLAQRYFENLVTTENFENLSITTKALESGFKLDYDPTRMTKDQILFQLKVLSEFRKVDYLGDYLSKGSRALNSIRQIPSDFASMENIKQLYNKFFDVEAAITNADPLVEEKVPVGIPERFPFSNVDLSTVLNISSSLNVLDEVMTATGKVFLREGPVLVNFSDRINTYMLNAGISDMQDQEKNPDEEYVKQYDRGFLDWNAARSLQKIRQSFVEYLLTGINFELPSGKTINMSVTDESPLEYQYVETEHDDEGTYQVTKTATATGVTAWVRRFVVNGIETYLDGKKVRLKPLAKLIEQYGFNSENANDFLANLSIRYTRESKTPYLNFAMGSSLDNIEKVDYENEFNNLKNLSIYETLDGKDVDPEVLGDDQYNELQYNLLKYDIIANGLGFGSYSYSQVMSIPIFRQVSKNLDELMFGLLDEKEAKYDIGKVKDHFALQLALMNVDKVRNINNMIEKDSEKQPVYGYDNDFDTYYDLIIKNYTDKAIKAKDIPLFAKRGSTLYIKVASEKNAESPHIYYQRVERYNETKSYSFNTDILYSDNGYRLGDYFDPSKLAISALSIKALKAKNTYSIEVNPKFEPRVTLATTGATVLIYSPSDYSRMNAEEFEVTSSRKSMKDGKEIVTLNLTRLSSESLKEDFLKFSIDEAERANKEIKQVQDQMKKNCNE